MYGEVRVNHVNGDIGASQEPQNTLYISHTHLCPPGNSFEFFFCSDFPVTGSLKSWFIGAEFDEYYVCDQGEDLAFWH